MSDFRKEFPDFPAADYPALPVSFTDMSWHNDVCPSMSSDRLGMIIYVDYADPKQREIPPGTRFVVLGLDPEGQVINVESPLLCTDDWSAVLQLIATRSIKGATSRQIIVDDPEAP